MVVKSGAAICFDCLKEAAKIVGIQEGERRLEHFKEILLKEAGGQILEAQALQRGAERQAANFLAQRLRAEQLLIGCRRLLVGSVINWNEQAWRLVNQIDEMEGDDGA